MNTTTTAADTFKAEGFDIRIGAATGRIYIDGNEATIVRARGIARKLGLATETANRGFNGYQLTIVTN